MAEASEPVAFETVATRRRYPWNTWESEPFKVWRIYQGSTLDFDIDPYHMAQVIYTRAERNKRKDKPAANASVQWSHAGWVEFCFYRNGEPRPIVGRNTAMTGTPAITAETAAALGIESVTCDTCGNVQQRVPHLTHLTTCLTNTPGKGMTADHYNGAPVTAVTTMDDLRQ